MLVNGDFMYRIIQLKWSEIETIHKQIYYDNPTLSYYQSYEYLTITGKGRKDKSVFSTVGLREVNYVLYKDDIAIAIAPLLVKNKNSCREIFLRGMFTPAGYLDFIYRKDIEYEDFVHLINEIRAHYKGARFYFSKINENALIVPFLKEIFCLSDFEIKKETCVAIHIPNTYEHWLSTLSKNARQNLRTSYNRLKTDNREVKTEIFYRQLIPAKTYRKILLLYCQRLAEKNKLKPVFALSLLLFTIKAINPASRSLKYSRDGFHALTFIDGQVASCCSGYICLDSRIIIPRFSINSKLARYSPGGILINEVIKDIIGKNENSDYPIISFDLSRGAEKYKYTYGGTPYNNLTFKVVL